MINLVKQTEPGLCMAACVAMVANTSIEDVLANARILKPEDGIRYMPDNEAIKFLAGRMLCYGLRIKPGEKISSAIETFTVTVPLECPAILAVASENFPGHDHAVVWDSERRMVLDPLHDDPQPIERYKVLEWVPVSHI